MRDAAAEHKRPLAGLIGPSLPQRLHSLLGLDRARKHCGIEPAVPPRDTSRRVIDFVRQAKVVERHQAANGNAARDPGLVSDVVVEQSTDIGRVGAVRRGSQPQKELRIHGCEDAPIRVRRCVVHFVNDDVVELLLPELREPWLARELGH